MIPYAQLLERFNGSAAASTAPAGGYRTPLLPHVIAGHAVYVAFGSSVSRPPDDDWVVSAPETWWTFDAETGDLVLLASGVGVHLGPGLPDLPAFRLEPPPARGDAASALEALRELIGMAAPEFFRGARPADGLAPYAGELVATGLGVEELAVWRQVAPDFLRWLLDG
jgi:hypothetical protein